MTLTHQKVSAAGAMFILSLLAASILFLGNQRLAHADVSPDLGSQIVCGVFTDLNQIGPPIPRLPGDCQNPPPALPQCSDGIDNDGNGRTDFPSDAGCLSSSDDSELTAPPPAAACSNTIDDDGDGLKDFPADPGCSSSLDTDESNAPPPSVENTFALCSDGVDNDADSAVDLADSDCSGFGAKLIVVKIVINDNGGTSTVSDFSLHVATTSTGLAHTIGVSSGATSTVAVGTWTVGEIQKSGYVGTFSGDCNSSGQVTLAAGETKTCTITNNDIAPGLAQCADGVDNDGDSLIDAADSGCSGTSDNDETNTSTPVPTPTSGGGGGGGGSGGGGGGIIVGLIVNSTRTKTASSSGKTLGVATTTALIPALVAKSTESCDRYLTAFIKSGAKNDADQVRRLQYILRDFEGMSSIEINGVYDAKTLAAVHAFQSKYAGDILTPWGITKSTGFTYLTTRKKANEIYCRNTKQFPLTSAEQKTIETVRSMAVPATPTTAAPAPASTPAKTNTNTSKDVFQSALVPGAVQETTKHFWNRVLDVFRIGR